jgi:hypothetical protein
MYTLERFGSVVLPVYNNSYTLSPIPAQLVLVQTTTGAFDNDGEGRNRPILPLPLSYKAVVTETVYNSNRAILDTLRAAVGTRTKLYRRADDDSTVHYCTARLSSMPHERPYSMRGYFEITLDFQQLTVWTGTIHGVGWVFDSGILLDTARTLDETPPVTLNTNPKTITVSNGGNLPITDIQFTIVAGSATITSVQLNGGLWVLKWIGSLPAGGTLIIDAGASMVLKNGGNDYNAFTLDAGHALDRWAMLQPGNTSVVVTLVGGSTNSTISIIYNDGWA